jgi:hypothetical protein
MAERTTVDVPIEASVRCTDGRAGLSEAVIVDPNTDVVTHVVVREPWPSRARRLVPTAMIGSTSDREIVLTIGQAELHRLDSFVGTETMKPVGQERYGAPSSAANPGPTESDTIELEPRYVRVENVPEGEVRIDAHAEVDATDGIVGHVGGFLLGDDDRVSSIAVRSKGIPHREFVVPATAVDRIEDERVKLRLDRTAVDALPHVHGPFERRREMSGGTT